MRQRGVWWEYQQFEQKWVDVEQQVSCVEPNHEENRCAISACFVFEWSIRFALRRTTLNLSYHKVGGLVRLICKSKKRDCNQTNSVAARAKLRYSTSTLEHRRW